MKIWILAAIGLTGIISYSKFGRTCAGGACGIGPAAARPQTDRAEVAATSATQSEAFESLEKALVDAKSQDKLVLVDVYTNWCNWCKKLDRDVYPAPEVQKELHSYFMSAKINAESGTLHTFGSKQRSESQIAAEWKVTGYPTILFLNPAGDIIERLSGYMPPKDFASALRYIGTRAYHTTSFEQWQAAHS
jgi:thioredoxin-related protein